MCGPAPVATAECGVVLSSLMNLARFSPALCVLFAGQINVQSRDTEHANCSLSMAAPEVKLTSWNCEVV